MRLLIAAVLVLAQGCATGPKVPDVVRVPVPVPCIEVLPAAPDLTIDDALLAMDDYRAVLTMWQDRLSARVAYEELRAIATGCIK